MLSPSSSTPSLRAKLAGESLFNDGMALLMFTVVLEWVSTNTSEAPTVLWELFIAPFLGGGFGLLIGRLACVPLARTPHRPTQSLITLALATGTWVVAERFHLSAPIAEVAAGLVVSTRLSAMSEATQDHIRTFWTTLDDVTNAALFALMGLELLVLPISPAIIFMGVLAWGAVLVGRTVGVAASLRPTPHHWQRKTGLIGIMSWAGLRGGMSLALALSLPPGPEARLLAAVTFLVVALSIMIQGLTLPRVLAVHARHVTDQPPSSTPTPSFEDDEHPEPDSGNVDVPLVPHGPVRTS
jgi:CPA1 family monovalent cation:H+ antiporter